MAPLSLAPFLFPQMKKLLKLVTKTDDEKWASKAVLSLAKKLKRGAMDDLEFALTNPELPSKCVTIPRSIDGRVQVSHRKTHPHVIYCRVWRWPDLHSHHELKSLEVCQFSFYATHKEVCINPYHYERKDCPVLPPILVPQNSESSVEHNRLSFSNLFHTTVRAINVSLAQHEFTPGNSPEYLSPGNVDQPIGSSWNPGIRNPSSPYDFLPADSPPPVYSPPHMMSNDYTTGTYSQATVGNSQNLTPVQFKEQENWCSISYYELCNRVGDVFRATNPFTIVDGFTDSNNDGGRFGIGILPNVNRNATVVRTRDHIGKGLLLYYIGGKVFVECLSNASIFIQSRSCNYLNGFGSATVCKIPPSCSLKVFDNQEFAKLLSETVNYGYKAVNDLIRMCTLKISFVKGFGAEYERQDVTSCPCWIETHLHGPLQWLDKVLVQMDSPTEIATSNS